MKKTKKYDRTRFSASQLCDAIEQLGHQSELLWAHINEKNTTTSYDSLEKFLEAYSEGFSWASAEIKSNLGSLALNVQFDYSEMTIESNETKLVDQTISLLDKFAPSVQVADKQELFKGLDVERFCVVSPLHWESLPLLPAHLEEYGITIANQEVSITRYPTTISYKEWAPAILDIRQNGEPQMFTVVLRNRTPPMFSLIIKKSKFTDTGESYIILAISGVRNLKIVDEVAAFLQLQPDKTTPHPRVDRTAFIAHRFDQTGEQLADRLARFLTLLGFQVQTGRAFSPKPVSEKVKERLSKQSIIFAILTPGDDATWLTQESIIGYSQDKPLFMLLDTNVDFKPGILGDLEYIPFTAPRIESTFISVLEGLNELGFLKRPSRDKDAK